MMTQDRKPANRDRTFLAEEKLLAAEKAGRFVGGKKPLEQTLGSLPKEVPITIYSAALAQGSYNRTQYGSRHFGSTTFGKHVRPQRTDACSGERNSFREGCLVASTLGVVDLFPSQAWIGYCMCRCIRSEDH